MKKGLEYIGVVERVEFPNKGTVRITKQCLPGGESVEVGEEDAGIRVQVKGVIEGQTVRFRVIRSHLSKRRAEGMLLSVESPSWLECESGCPQSKDCGGCFYQTLSYENQLAIKESLVHKLMDEVISEPYEFLPILGSPNTKAYRNKMEYSFGDEYKGGPLSLGLHKRGSFYDVLTTDRCVIVHEDYNRIVRAVLSEAQKTGLRHFHKITHLGYFRHLVVRRAQKTGEILVHIVTSSQSEGKEEAFLQNLVEKLCALSLDGTLCGIVHSRNDNLSDAVESDETRVIYGRGFFYEEILGLRFRITPFSFFQTNSLGAELLYKTARDFIGNTKDKRVFDLYSGTGTIAQVLAPVARHVIGVEIVAEAVEAARENAKDNGLDNCEFIAGDVLKMLDTIAERPDLIMLDPPREGIAPKALEKIIAYGVERLVYISCKPTSLQNDLRTLLANGYRVEKIQTVDMFPGTIHCETVCLLSRKA